MELFEALGVTSCRSVKCYSLQRGVAITVDNLSARTLGSPTLWVRCGWVDDRLGTPHPVSIKWSLGTIPNFYASTIIRIRLDILHHTAHQPPAWRRRRQGYTRY